MNNFMLFGGCTYATSVLAPNMVEDLGLNAAKIGIGFMLCQLISGLLAPFITHVMARVGIRNVMVIGQTLFIIFILSLNNLVKNTTGFIAAMAFGGLALLCSPIPMATLASRWFTKKRGTAISIVMTSGGTAGFVLSYLMQMLVETYGSWHLPLLVLVGMAVVCGIIVFLIVHDDPQDRGLFPDGGQGDGNPDVETGKRDGSPSISRGAVSSPVFWVTLFCTICASWTMNVVISQSIFYLESVGINKITGALTISFFALSAIVGALLSGILSDRVGAKTVLVAAQAALIIGFILLLLTRIPAVAFIYATVLGLGTMGTMVSAPALLAACFGVEKFAPIYGWFTLLMILVGSSSPAFAGFIYVRLGSYTPAFVGIAAAVVVSIVLAIRMKVTGKISVT